MPNWSTVLHSATLSTQGAHDNSELLYNQLEAGDEPWENRDVVVVDGIVTVISNSDDLIGVRLLVAHEIIVDGDLSDTQPSDPDDMIWYTWFAGRGPLVFRIRSKRTIPTQYKLWGQMYKALGSTSTAILVAYRLYTTAV